MSDSLALIEEVTAKNHLRVAVHRAHRGRRSSYPIHRLSDVFDSKDVVGSVYALALADHGRILTGRKPIWLGELHKLSGGDLRSVAPNIRTNAGIDFIANAVSGAAQTIADWVALSSNSAAVAATDTSAVTPWSTGVATDVTTGEFTGLGMTRKQVTYAHSAAATTYTMTASYTATGTVTNVQKAGMFGGTAKTAQTNNTATNILVFASLFAATTLASSDVLTLTWTISFP